ncbi:phage tail tape measure protein [Vagococcus fluvialis]|uniref:phage tail tape measure protein n=1 Tax=Vagococcus fluvialis TaxID=2738 RepID=UPI001D0AA4F7|nr:phage tail tape measure protein [Vagococcus fluvialis]UDM70658.1 phage tail tape measure protein [Vagococcus fluvialis]UDM78077.1 phage tail tape measure protein [Vagococcus fluvialis]UDM82346.1 phage tail tape measure protein [Vagococcus fluvialis]
MSNIGNIAATASLNIDPFQQSARVLETQTRSIDRALKATETAFKTTSNNINAQKTQYQLTGKAIDVHNAKLEKQKEKYNGLKNEIGDVNNATVQQKTDLLAAEAAINKTANEIEGLTGKYNALGKQIAINESNWTKGGKALEDFGNKTTRVGEGLDSFGNKMTLGVTAPIVAGVTAVTKAAMDWESSFAGVKKTVDEVVDSNGRVTYSYKDLENGLRGLAKELPSSHKEIAAVAEAAGQLGIETPNVVAFTKTMIDLGESTSMSAETAATELARFANITGMSQDKFSNLGSALVDLGNNFATTESEISALSLRLAGAGSQIGMTEGEILGFAAALSSVGVEAEAGGSAFSKVMIQMQLATEKGMGSFDELIQLGNQSGVSFEQMSKAVQDGGKNLKATAGQMGLTSKQLSSMYKEADKSATSLQNFAEVAGMTNAEFGNLFKQDPSKAIMKFVEGLSKAEEQGISAIKVLDDMDITEVRLRDSLLRAANASGVFSDAVSMGNKAFGENTALAEEAGKRYATVESQLKMLKNEAVDMGIELGGPFLEALRSGLQAAKPFISTLSDMATKFSEMNPESQQSIMKFIGLAAAIGPASKVLGGFLKITGGGISTVGKMAQGIGKMSGTAKASKLALDAASTGMKVVGTSATVATGAGATGLTGFVAGLGTIAVPAAIAVGSIAAIGTALYVGKKAYDNHQLAGAKWGTEVTKEQDKVIEKSYELRDKATSYIDEYADGVRGSADKAIQANQEIVDSIQKTIEKEHDRKVKNAEQLEDGPIKDSLKQQAENDKKYGEQLAQQAQERVNKINSILSNASKNTREISDQERQYIEANYKQLSAKQLELAGFTKNQITAIESAYQKDLTKLSYNELETRANNVSKALNSEQESYKKSRQAILDGTKEGTQRQISLLKELDTEHKNSTESMVLGLAKLRMEQGHSIDSMAAVWEQYGWTVEEVERLVAKSAESSSKNLDMFAKGMNEADIRWNELAFDPKTGEVKTNMADTLVEIAATEDGWNQLEFMAKNADLTTNAKEEIAIAMGEVDKWQFLSMDDKRLLLENDEAMLKLYDSIDELGKWDVYNADRKTLGVDNADALYSLMESKGALETWINLPVEVKQLITTDESSVTVEQAQRVLETYEALDPKTKALLGDNTDVNSKLRAAEEKLNSYERNNPKTKHLHATDNASGPASIATTAVQEFSRQRDHTVTMTSRFVTINETIYQEGKAGGHRAIRATGDPYFQGGPVWLGDGGKQEPYLTPQGDFGISPADWTLYDLPRGTKIWPSISKMMETLPQYSKGTQFDDTVMSRFKVNQSASRGNNSDSHKLDSIINLLSRLLTKDTDFSFNGTVLLENGYEVGRWLSPVLKNEFSRDSIRGKRNRGDRD